MKKGAYLYMKKILSVLLALTMLLVPVLAMAEAAQAVTYQSYTHTDDQYTIEYADNWLMLNAELISNILNTMDTSEDEQLALLVNTYGPQIQQMDMVLFLSESGMTNVNIVYQEMGLQLTGDLLMSMAPNFVAQLSQSFEGIQFLNEGSLIAVNGVDSLMIEYAYELSGQQMQGAQVYVPGSTGLCLVTYTCGNADELVPTVEVFSDMLNSLQVK